jgi:predicted dehydrogenase
MHTLLVLDPGHFHAALTLRASHPRVAAEVFVYAGEGPELRDFLSLLERFNHRPEHPTSWRLVVITCADPLARLLEERRGDVVILAGRNGGKARTIHRLHDAGFHVLADKPWVVHADDLDHVRASLAGGPRVVEIMTGRHDVAARVLKRLVDAADVFGAFRSEGPAIELESVHQLEKRVDGVPLRRPWWFFDIRVQGSGPVDIPTHLVDQTQWLLDGTAGTAAETTLLSTRAWSTRVPADAFYRITGETAFPRALGPFLDGDALSYLCNAELVYRIGAITARAAARWDLSAPAGGGDAHCAIAHGTRADIRLEQSAHTGGRRRLFVEPRADADAVARGMIDALAAARVDFPGMGVERAGGGRCEVTIPAALDSGHESHFPRVLDDFLDAMDDRHWPAALAERTLAKYTLLAEAAARTTPREDDR